MENIKRYKVGHIEETILPNEYPEIEEYTIEWEASCPNCKAIYSARYDTVNLLLRDEITKKFTNKYYFLNATGENILDVHICSTCGFPITIRASLGGGRESDHFTVEDITDEMHNGKH